MRCASTLSRPSLSRSVVAGVAAATLATTAGCGMDDPVFEPSIGSNARSDTVDALGFAIVTDGEGNGRVVGSLLNTGEEPDALVGVDVELESGTVEATMPSEDIALPVEESVELARVPAIGVVGQLPEGRFVEITLDFEVGPDLDLLVPVEPQRGPYAEIEVTQPPDDDVSPS